MGIQNDTNTLKQRILDALTKTTLKDGKININDETGEVSKSDQTPALKHPEAISNIKITAGKPSYMQFQNEYNNEEQVGIDALIEIIIRETLNYLQQNVEIVMKDRIDKLETDFDSFVTSMAGSGVGAATAVPAAVASYLLTSDTVSRAALKIQETQQRSEIK